jgi:hypothetical protein
VIPLLPLLASFAAAGRLGGASIPPKEAPRTSVPALGVLAVPVAAAASQAARTPGPVSYEEIWRDPQLGALGGEAAKGDETALAQTTGDLADGSARREMPAEAVAEPPQGGLKAIGRALTRLIKREEPPRISAFTWAQSNPRHPIYETSVLFTRREAYIYDKDIAEAVGVAGFYSFMSLDDDYIEVRTDDIREAATLAAKLAKVELVRGVFVSPRVLALINAP